jgi:hypothetical protein
MDIGIGEYRRTFKADEQPFAAEDAEEEQLLRNTGFFVSDKEAEAEAGTDDVPATAETIVSDENKAASSRRTPKPAGRIGGAPASGAAEDAN